MKAFTKHKPTGSSKPLFSGDLSITLTLDAFDEDFEETMIEIIDEALSESQERIKKLAYSNDEWDAYADILSVSVVNDSIVYSHEGTDEEDQRMFDLEFGGPEKAPNPLLRKIAEQETAAINKSINTTIVSLLGYV